MKNIVMLVVVLAGLSTAIYRFLPHDTRTQIDTRITHLTQTKALLPSLADSESKPKKHQLVIPDGDAAAPKAQAAAVASAYIQHLENVRVQGEGRLVKVLPDDNDGSRHQRFILRTPEDLTVLIAHNIDLAQRVSNLTIGDTIYFSGEYVWNEKGGVVHWTHHDPRGHHASGWLKHNGVTYQ